MYKLHKINSNFYKNENFLKNPHYIYFFAIQCSKAHFYKSNAKLPILGSIVQIFVTIGGFALFL